MEPAAARRPPGSLRLACTQLLPVELAEHLRLVVFLQHGACVPPRSSFTAVISPFFLFLFFTPTSCVERSRPRVGKLWKSGSEMTAVEFCLLSQTFARLPCYVGCHGEKHRLLCNEKKIIQERIFPRFSLSFFFCSPGLKEQTANC